METLPCWLVFVSQLVMIFFILTGFNPWRNLIMTLARSIGLPVSAELTCTVSLVPDPAGIGREKSVRAKRRRPAEHSLRMASIMRHRAEEIDAGSRLLPLPPRPRDSRCGPRLPSSPAIPSASSLRRGRDLQNAFVPQAAALR